MDALDSGVGTYEEAAIILEEMFVAKRNEIYQRYCLSVTSQKPEESVEQYRLTLESLAGQCTFTDQNASQFKETCLIDSFVRGISSNEIRQRLLEPDVNMNSWKQVYDKAKTLEMSQKSLRNR